MKWLLGSIPFSGAFQGVEVTGGMAVKSDDNPLRKHWLSTDDNPFLSSKGDICSLLHFGCFGSEKQTLYRYFQTVLVIFFGIFFLGATVFLP